MTTPDTTYDRIVGSDQAGNLSPTVQAVLDDIIDNRATALIPPTSPYTLLKIGDGSATLPVRPSTPLAVAFDTTTQPPLNGTTRGGTTGMVPGLDKWLGATGSGGSQLNVVVENPLGSGTYGNRPATTQAVIWKGVVAPNGGGTVAGGTPLMVNNLDEWHQWVLG